MPARRRFVTAGMAAVVALVPALSLTASAEADPILPLPTTTTTAGPPGTTTTTTSPLPGPGSTTTTTSSKTGGSTTTTTSTTAPTNGAAGDGSAAPGSAQTIPPEYLPLIAGVKRSPANSTKALLASLRPLTDLGIEPAQILAAGFGRFPVGGEATFRDDWWEPRFTPTFHLHQGTDIFAAEGTPVRAPADGVLRQSNEAVGGMSAYVTTPDGSFFYMAHLSAFAEGQKTGQAVHTGDIVGFVGATGDAQGGAPHCHFEIHPRGGAATDPKAFLDDWLNQAVAAAPSVIAGFEAKVPRALLATALTRGIQGLGTSSAFAAPTGPSDAQLLWVGSANPAGGGLRIAESAAVRVARAIDWAAEADGQAAGAGTPARG